MVMYETKLSDDMANNTNADNVSKMQSDNNSDDTDEADEQTKTVTDSSDDADVDTENPHNKNGIENYLMKYFFTGIENCMCMCILMSDTHFP